MLFAADNKEMLRGEKKYDKIKFICTTNEWYRQISIRYAGVFTISSDDEDSYIWSNAATPQDDGVKKQGWSSQSHQIQLLV